MKDRLADGPDTKRMIASRFNQNDRLTEEALTAIVSQGFLKYTQASPCRQSVQRAIAELLCDIDRLAVFVQMLYAAGLPDWCTAQSPIGHDALFDQMSCEFGKAILDGVQFDDAPEYILQSVSWLCKGTVERSIENRHDNDPEYHP
ncbi:hypothetical protein JYU10_00810 [bacterium AH-315-J04]|nr:hypothetical protein [bacterium AH-315-J04]